MSLADVPDRADVQHWWVPIAADLFQGAVGHSCKAQAGNIADEPLHQRGADGVGEPRREAAQQEAELQHRKTEYIPWDDVYGRANGHGGLGPLLEQVDGDLAGGVAETNDQHVLSF